MSSDESAEWSSDDSLSSSFLSDAELEEGVGEPEQEVDLVDDDQGPRRAREPRSTPSRPVPRRRDSVIRPVSRDGSSRQDHGEQPGSYLLRPHRCRRASVTSNNAGGGGSNSALAYAEALRTSRLSSHRASISMAATAAGISGGNSNNALSDETRRRHRESKRRMECIDLMQLLLFQAHELDEAIEDMPLYLHARVIPPRWRVQIMTHLEPIREQMQFCQARVLHAWHLLLPPFDRVNLHEFETRLRQFELSVACLRRGIQECEEHVHVGEQTSACVFLQIWYRRHLAHRGFYTRKVAISRHHRGLIPGMFDTIPGKSKLTLQPRIQQASLEYPISPTAEKHAFGP